MSVRMPFFIPAHPTMTKRSTSNKCNHNKATVKKKPYRYSIADRVLQRCIKLNHITPFDCVTDEAPHRQIPYERRPFRGVRVFQISQDSLDYFLVAIQYLRKVVAIEHSEHICYHQSTSCHAIGINKNRYKTKKSGTYHYGPDSCKSINSMFQCSKENVSRRQREINYTKNLASTYLY